MNTTELGTPGVKATADKHNRAQQSAPAELLSLSLSVSRMTMRLQNSVSVELVCFCVFSSDNSGPQRLQARTATAAVAVRCAELHVQEHLLIQLVTDSDAQAVKRISMGRLVRVIHDS